MDSTFKNKASMASFLASALLAARPVMGQVEVDPTKGRVMWHPEPPPVLQRPCVVVDKTNNRSYIVGYDSKDTLTFEYIDQTMCEVDWQKTIWTSLPKPGGSWKYETEFCFLTADGHVGVPYQGGFAVWDHIARTWTYKTTDCGIKYPNHPAVVHQDKGQAIDTVLVHHEDSTGGHLTGIQFIHDNVNSCYPLPTTNVPTGMVWAASPGNNTSYFLFGKEKSCWYDITAENAPSSTPVKTDGDCHPLPGLNIRDLRTVVWGSSIYIFGKNDVGLGVWSIDTSGPGPYQIIPRSQGAPVNGDYAVADCGSGIIVYPGCDASSKDKCSTTLKPGEPFPPTPPVPPTVIYKPPGSGNPGTGNPGTGNPGTGNPGTGNPGTGNPGTGNPGTGNPGTGNPGTGNPGTGNPGTGNPGTGNPGTGEPGTGNPGTGNPGTGNPGTGNPGTGNPGTGNPGTGNPGTGNPGTGNPGTGNPGTGNPGDGGSWIPPPGPGIPTGIPSGGPTAVPTGPGTVPTLPPGVLPGGDGAKTSGDKSNTGAIIGGIIGALCLIALVALLFVFARRRRRRQEEVEEGHHYPGAPNVADHTTGGTSAHGGLPPLAPVAPIGELDEVEVLPKDGPRLPGGPSGSSHIPGGPTDASHIPGGPTDASHVPGGPSSGGSHSHLPIGAAIGGALIGGAIASSRRSSDEQERTHGHVPKTGPTPGRPAGPSTNYEQPGGPSGNGGIVPPCRPGSPDDERNTPGGPSNGGIVPAPIGGTKTVEEIKHEHTSQDNETSNNKGIIGGIVGGIVAGAAAVGSKLYKNNNQSSTSISHTTTTTRTTSGGCVHTTTGPGGRTIITERTQSGNIRHILTGAAIGTTVRTVTRRAENGDEVLVPCGESEGDEREVITERDQDGKLRYIIGGLIAGAAVRTVIRTNSGGTTTLVTRITKTTRIITERTTTGTIRYIIVGGFSGNAIRVYVRSTNPRTGEIEYVPTNEPDGELHHVIEERSGPSGEIKYVLGDIVASSTIVHGGAGSITSTTRIVTERTPSGEIRYIIVGGFSGNAIRVIEQRTQTGETVLVPTADPNAGQLRHVISERTETGEIRYVIGGVITGKTITKVIMGPRIVSEKTVTGQIRYVIVDPYNGNAIRTKFERNPETGEYVHIPVKEPEGELRYVHEERTETGEIRKVIGEVVTGNVTVTTRTESGSVVPSSPTEIRIVSETDEAGVTRYYQITRDNEGKEVRALIQRTESGSFRTLDGTIIAGGVVPKVVPQQQEQVNKTQITLKLSIMRYERADAKDAVPAASIGTVLFSKFKKIADGEVNIPDTAYTHVEEIKTSERRTVKWMRTEAHWKREAGMLQHLKSDRYVADLYTLYSLPAFAEYRFVSILGSFSRTLESYISTEQLSLAQIRSLTLSLSDALLWCHEHHVVHLNINPASFYLAGVPGHDLVHENGQGVWKLWNFGHARFVGEAVDISVADATYAAPEILNGMKDTNLNVLATVSMDRWSLGLVLYELFARKKMFRSAAIADAQLSENNGAFEPNLDRVEDMDAKVAIRGLLEVDPEKRFNHEMLREVYFGKV